MEIRELTFSDAVEARRLSQEAFGVATAPLPEPDPATWQPAGTTSVGAFDGDRLVGKVVGRSFTSWFGGAELATWGIAGVTIEAEARGGGLLRRLFDASFAAARREAMVLSTLYPTAQGIYRPLGYERVGEYVDVEAVTTTLADVRLRPGDEDLHVRRCGPDDLPALQDVMRRWAAQQQGTLGLPGLPHWASFDDYLEDATGITAVLDGTDTMLGFCRWTRGQGVGPGSTILVDPLVWTTAAAGRSLLRFLGSFRSASPTVRVKTSAADPTLQLLSSRGWVTVHQDPYMFRVLDVAAAIEPRAYAPMLTGRVGFSVVDEVVPACAGDWTLELADGRARCTRGGGGVRLTPQALALLFTGVQPVGTLRALGLATGGDPARDRDLDAVFAGPGLQLREYF